MIMLSHWTEPDTRRTFAQTFPAENATAGRARALVGEALEHWELGYVGETARLVMSELITNAIRAAGDGAEVSATVVLTGRAVYVGAWDPSEELPVPRPAGDEDEDGRGWTIIEALSLACGVDVDAHRGGKTAWAKIPFLA